MKKGIILLIGILILIPSTSGGDIPFSETVEIKNADDQYNQVLTLPVHIRKGSTHEPENRIVQIKINPKHFRACWEDGNLLEEKDYFFEVLVSISIADPKGTISTSFESYLNYELQNCNLDTWRGQLFWDHAGEARADRAGQPFRPEIPLVVEDQYFRVTLSLLDVKKSNHYCKSNEQSCLDCKSDARCLVFIDSLTLSLTVTYSCEECYTGGQKDFNEGMRLFLKAAETGDAKQAIDTFKEARSYFEKAQTQFEKIGAAESDKCQTQIEQCDSKINGLEDVLILRTRLLYIVGAIVVAAGAGGAIKKIRKMKARPPKESLTLRVRRVETGEEVSVEVNRLDKIGKVRQLAGTRLGIVPSELVYNGKVCPPDRTVEECGLKDGAAITILPLKEEKERRKPEIPQKPRIIYEDKVFPTVKDSITIGRDENADIKILDTEKVVSRIHARVYRDEKGQYWVQDNNSTNGTFILKDGEYKKIKKWALHPGDIIVLCHSDQGKEFKLMFEAKILEVEETRIVGARVVIGGKSYLLTKEITTIGRGEDADIRVDDPEKLVSRIHARIYKKEGQCWVEDNKSANGTFIFKDGKFEKIEKWTLSDGDTIGLSFDPSRGVRIAFQFKIG